jgi:hypothetical protein
MRQSFILKQFCKNLIYKNFPEKDIFTLRENIAMARNICLIKSKDRCLEIILSEKSINACSQRI